MIIRWSFSKYVETSSGDIAGNKNAGQAGKETPEKSYLTIIIVIILVIVVIASLIIIIVKKMRKRGEI